MLLLINNNIIHKNINVIKNNSNVFIMLNEASSIALIFKLNLIV